MDAQLVVALTSPIISAVAGLLGALIGYRGSQRTTQLNIDLAREQRRFERAQEMRAEIIPKLFVLLENQAEQFAWALDLPGRVTEEGFKDIVGAFLFGSMGRHSAEGMQLRYCGLGECKAPCRRVARYDPSLYRGSGVFTIVHIDPSPQDVGITHLARMRRGASPVVLRQRSMQHPEYRVPRMHLLLTGSWVNKPFSDAPVFGRCHHAERGHG